MAVILPVVPNVIQSKLRWTVGTDSTCWSHFFWKYTGGPPLASDLATFANGIQAKWGLNMNPLQRTDVVLTEVINLDLSTRATAPGTWTGTNAGTRTGTALPAQTCALVNCYIGRRYRGGKPRLYLPLGNAADVTAPQAWGSSFISVFGGNFTNFLNAVFGNAVGTATISTWVNVSYYDSKTLRVTPVVDNIAAYALNSIPGSQRRRMNR